MRHSLHRVAVDAQRKSSTSKIGVVCADHHIEMKPEVLDSPKLRNTSNIRPLSQRVFGTLFPKVFYGYLVLAGCVCMSLASTPGQSFFLGLYTEKFIDDFEISRSSMSSIFFAAFICSAFAVQIIGKVIDWLGPHTAICWAAIPYLCGIALTVTASGPAAITAGFFLTRILGPDGIDFAGKVIINRWFQRQRGRAMAVASITVAIEILLSGGFDRLADSIGWRAATALACFAVAVLIAGGLLVLFDSPEALGLAPDGDPPTETPTESPAAAVAPDVCFTSSEAAQTCAFWIILALAFTASMGWGGLNVHMRSICSEQSLPPATITAIYTAIGISMPIGSVLMGWAMDRAGAAAGPAGILRIFSTVPAMSALSILLAAGVGAVGSAGTSAIAVLFGIVTGLFLGLTYVTISAAAASLFGRGPHLASIQALVAGARTLGIASGPVLLAAGRDATGSYVMPLLGFATAASATCAAILLCPVPRKEQPPAVETGTNEALSGHDALA